MGKDGAEGLPFAQTAPHIPCEKEDAHRQIPVFLPGLLEPAEDIRPGGIAQSTRRGKKIQTGAAGGGMGERAVFGMGHGFVFHCMQHHDCLLFCQFMGE